MAKSPKCQPSLVATAKIFVEFSPCVTQPTSAAYAKSACKWFVNSVSAKAVIHSKRNSNAKKLEAGLAAGLKE